jgi:hypothetical protein
VAAGTSNIQRLMLWDEPRPTLKDFLKFKPDQLMAFVRFVDRFGFDADFEKTLELATDLGVSHERAIDLIRYAELIDDQRSRLQLTSADVLQEFRTYVSRRGLEFEKTLPSIEPALSQLFKERGDEARLYAKRKVVAAGIIPNALVFESLCDLRPVFNEARDRILDYVSVALIRVRTHSDRHDSDDLVFQIDRGGLRLLEQFTERLRKKFDVIEESRKRLLEENH